MWERRDKVEGAGAGWGQAQEPASQCARVCQNYPLAIYPVVSSRRKSDFCRILGILGDFRHWVNGVGRAGGQAVSNQMFSMESGRNPVEIP